MNYFFSGWIENLGVVPVFRSWAFLFLPMFFFLFSRLLRVCIVRDVMTVILLHKPGMTVKCCFLPILSFLVKASPPLALSKTVYTLSSGEHLELKVGIIDHYSLGNNTILTHKFFPKEGKFLIKAKKLGHTQLIFWKNGTPQKIDIFVISTSKHLEMAPIISYFQAIKGIKVFSQGPFLKLKGVLYRREDYFLIQDLIKKKSNILTQLKVSKKLRRSITLNVTMDLFRLFTGDINCHFSNIALRCFLRGPKPLEKSHSEYLEKKYFLTIHYQYKSKEYPTQVEIFKIQKKTGEAFQWDLPLSFSLQDSWQQNLILKHEDYLISTLTKLKMPLIPLKKSTLKFSTKELSSKTNFLLIENHEQLTIKFTHNMTLFETTSHQTGEIILRPGKKNILFSQDYYLKQKSEKGLLSIFPFSLKRQSVYVKIVALIWTRDEL